MLGTHVHHFGWHLPRYWAFADNGRDGGIGVVGAGGDFPSPCEPEPIILFMATIGLAYFMEGLAT